MAKIIGAVVVVRLVEIVEIIELFVVFVEEFILGWDFFEKPLRFQFFSGLGDRLIENRPTISASRDFRAGSSPAACAAAPRHRLADSP